MALQSKTISAKGSRGHHTFSLTVTEDSTNVSANESILSFEFKLVDDNNWFWSAQGTYVSYKITIGSHTYEGYIPHHTSVTTEVRSESDITELHNSDGTKTINIGFTVTDSSSISYLPGNASSSSTMALTTIPRASGVSVGNVTISSTSGSLSATINPQASFWHRWKYVIGSYDSGWTNMSSAISSATSISVAYTTILSKITASSSGTVVFTVETHNSNAFNSSSYIGTASATSTVTITLKPSAPTLTTLGFRSRSSGVNSNITTPTAGYTTVALTSWSNGTSSGATSYTTYFSVDQGASLKTTSATANNTVIETNTLPSSAKQYTLTYTAYTVDSRGNKSSNATKTVVVYGYSTPTLNLTAYRVASSSATTEDATGTYAYVTFSNTMRGQTDANGSLRSGNQNAIVSATCKYGSTTVTSGQHIALAVENTLTFTYTVQDRFTTTSTTRTVNSASFPLDLYDDGAGNVGVGLGTVALSNGIVAGKQICSTTRQSKIIISDVSKAEIQAQDDTLTTSSSDNDWFTALLKAIVAKYPSNTHTVFVGHFQPASRRWYTVYIYDTSAVSNGLPQYAFGYYMSPTSGNTQIYTFGSYSYTFYRNNIQWAVGATNATNATNYNVIVNDPTSGTWFRPVFVANTSGNLPGYNNNGLMYNCMQGTSSAVGNCYLRVGNETGQGTAGNKRGILRLYSNTAYCTDLLAPTGQSANHYNVFLPNGNGTMEAYTTLWTGTLQGGAEQSINMSAYSRIRVYALTWGVQHVFEVDLSDAGKAQSGHGLTNTSYPFQGGSVVGHYDGANQSGTFQHYSVSVKVLDTKTKLWVSAIGYANTNGAYVNRNSNSEYYVYRVDGII